MMLCNFLAGRVNEPLLSTVDTAVRAAIAAGFRTRDLASGAPNEQLVSTSGMGDAVISFLH